MPTGTHSFPEIDQLRADIVASSVRRQRIAVVALIVLIGVAVAWVV